MNEDLKERAFLLYFWVKKMDLLAEETSPDFKKFLQPSAELNRAFDHISRAVSIEIGIKENNNPDEYIKTNYEKAIGHFYRAFFDIADWLSMNLRRSVIDEFKDYSHECIIQVIPEYYSEIKPKLESVSEEVAEFRDTKDIGNSATFELMGEYKTVIDELREMLNQVRKKIAGVIDCEERLIKEKKDVLKLKILLILFGAAVGTAFTFFFL